jgi:hypothetical protein
MQAKRNTILAVSLVALVVITVMLYVGTQQRQHTSTLPFIGDVSLETVDAVMLESPTEKINLHYVGNTWRLNDTYNVDRNMVDVLFATLQQVVAKRSITGSLRDSLSNVLKEQGVRVSLVENGNVKKSFYAGGNVQKSIAYFQEEGSKEVWVGVIPGYRVYAAGIFELETKAWRDRLAFGLNWQNFKMLTLEFPSAKDGIAVTLEGDVLQVAQIQEVDTTKLYPFMDAIALLTVDQYVDVDTSTIREEDWILTVKLEDIGKRVFSLKVYPQPGSQNYLGLINETDWAVFGKNKVLEIKHPRSYFKLE